MSSINVKDLKKSVNGFKRVTSRLTKEVIASCQNKGFKFDAYALKYDMGKRFTLEAVNQNDGSIRYALEILDENNATERMYMYS